MIRALFIGVILQFSLVLHSQQSWQPLDINDTIQPVSILPISYDTVIIGVRTYGEYPHGGIYRSIDAGESWQFYETEYGTWRVYPLMLAENGDIFAGTNLGLYKSEDLGESWENVISIFKSCTALEQVLPNTIFAGFRELLLRSNDYGTTWDTCFLLDQNTYINSILAVADSLIYFSATSYTSNDGGLYASYDGGINWDRIGLVMYNIQSLAFSPNNELYAGCWYVGLLKSTDYGLTWETVLPQQDAVSVISRGNEVFVGCAHQSYITSGIFYSGDNGATWEDRTHNIINRELVQIAFSDDDFLYSLSRYEYSSLGTPLYRSINPVVGIDEARDNDLTFTFYPNPSNSSINVVIPEEFPNKHQNIKLSVYNLNGQIVAFESIPLKNRKGKVIRFNVSNLKPGLYIIKINGERSFYSNKLLII